MQRIAVPMVGDMISTTILTLAVIPAIYGLVKGWRLAENSDSQSDAIESESALLKPAAE